MSDTTFLKDNLSGTVPVEISKEIIKNIKDRASMLNVCKLESMTSDKKTLPRLSDSGSATWVNEGEAIGTTIPKFDYPQLKAKKLAIIIPITKEKINDSVVAVLNEVKQAIADSFATAIDKATIFGIDSPFDTSLIDAIGEQKIVATADFDTDLSNAMGLVEDSKYNCNNVLMGINQKKVLRALANDNKYKGSITLKSIYETPIEFVRDFDIQKALSITGDFNKAIIGTRENITYEILKEATIENSDKTMLNLAQQDMIAVKATMRLAFVVADSKAFSAVVAGE